MWGYVHAQAVARVMARVQAPAPDHTEAAERFLRALIEARVNFSVLQVGSYDGVSNDPVHELIRRYHHVPKALPAVILYEHRCLSRRVQESCERLLSDRGYAVSRINKADTLASRCGPPGF